mmetsp:Transcript_53710/g.123091  ORF Transcript_53710/g.123091 Transcript_53710/m.123091 type:complete len:248 (-) Transcript_53710:7-750(-)
MLFCVSRTVRFQFAPLGYRPILRKSLSRCCRSLGAGRCTQEACRHCACCAKLLQVTREWRVFPFRRSLPSGPLAQYACAASVVAQPVRWQLAHRQGEQGFLGLLRELQIAFAAKAVVVSHSPTVDVGDTDEDEQHYHNPSLIRFAQFVLDRFNGDFELAFSNFDEDRGGQLTRVELTNAARKFGYPSWYVAADVRSVFRLVDKDSSQSLDVAEFRTLEAVAQSCRLVRKPSLFVVDVESGGRKKRPA